MVYFTPPEMMEMILGSIVEAVVLMCSIDAIKIFAVITHTGVYTPARGCAGPYFSSSCQESTWNTCQTTGVQITPSLFGLITLLPLPLQNILQTTRGYKRRCRRVWSSVYGTRAGSNKRSSRCGGVWTSPNGRVRLQGSRRVVLHT